MIRLLTFVSIVILCYSCSGKQESVSEAYSLKMEKQIQEDNARKQKLVDYSYAQIDKSMALHVVTDLISNMDLIIDKAIALKTLCIEFRSYLDSALVYSPTGFPENIISQEIDSFKLAVVDLIDDTNFSKEGLIEDIYEVLDPIYLIELSSLTPNEFRIEKELFKGRILEVESMAVQTLLGEMNYIESLRNWNVPLK